jgi:serine/threonine-protein kinase
MPHPFAFTALAGSPSDLAGMFVLLSLAGLGALTLFKATQLSVTRLVPAGAFARRFWSGVSWTLGVTPRARVVSPLRLGAYALQRKIGEGGQGVVYQARHADSRRLLAIKLMAGDCSNARVRRFEREGRLTAGLSHPNTVTIYDQGRTPEGVSYYAMELLDGLTLAELVERHGPLPAGRAIHILLQLSAALEAAHARGLVHRDIKPANVYVCARDYPPDFVKLLDFGLVREVDAGSDPAVSGANALVGTPLFLSPEAITLPDQVDARADIYGVGAVAYFLLTGRTPFQGRNAVEVCAHHLHTVPEAPSRYAAVPADLERLILACLAKDRAERPANARALLRALERCEARGSWQAADAERWWERHAAC